MTPPVCTAMLLQNALVCLSDATLQSGYVSSSTEYLILGLLWKMSLVMTVCNPAVSSQEPIGDPVFAHSCLVVNVM